MNRKSKRLQLNSNSRPSYSKGAGFNKAKKRLASHPEARPETLRKIADGAHPEILERVAENLQTPVHTLETLSEHESSDVRGAVSENLNTPIATLETLAHDENPDVRFRLAENPSIPTYILETLAEDENPYVSARAQTTLHSVTCLSDQADDLFLQERFDEAEALYRDLVCKLEVLLGSQHLEVANALHKMSAALAGQNKIDESVRLKSRANAITQAHTNLLK